MWLSYTNCACAEAINFYLEKSWRKLSPVECDVQNVLEDSSKPFWYSPSVFLF